MRKLLLFFILLISLQGFSQSVYYSTKFCSGVANADNDGWIWEEDQEARVKITIHGKMVLVDDEAKSSYTCGVVYMDKEEDDCHQTAWWATDEKQRRCMFKLVIYKSGRIDAYVMYFNQGVALLYRNLVSEN